MSNLNVNTGNAGTAGFGGNTLGDASVVNNQNLAGLDALLAQPSLTFAGADRISSKSSSSEPEPTEENPEIVVTARRPSRDRSDPSPTPGIFNPVLHGDTYINQFTTFTLPPLNFRPTVTINVKPENQQKAEILKQRIEQETLSIAEKLAKLPDMTKVEFKDGKTMTAGELKDLFSKAKIEITD